MRNNIGSNLAAATPTAAAAIIRQVAQTSPAAAAELEKLCNGINDANGGQPIARVRSAQLYSKAGITIAAAGTTAVQTATAFAVGVNNANASLAGGRVMTFADTNLTTGGSLKNSAFLATGFGVKYEIDTAAGNVGATTFDEVLPQLQWILDNTSLSLQIGAQDVQRLGSVGDWPAGFSSLPNVPGGAAIGVGTTQPTAGGAAAYGPWNVFDFDLSIPAETTIRLDCKVERANTAGPGGALAGGNDVVIALKTTFYGYEITALQG
jgi:hypothetical protein